MWATHIREGKMSYWPIVTVVISLILILFFRRLDKRLINFHKFKRYSDKLMADFEEFLKQRKEELKANNPMNRVGVKPVRNRGKLLLEVHAGEVSELRRLGKEE